jgi:hypothetical protein
MSSKPLYSIGNSCYEDRALMAALPKKAKKTGLKNTTGQRAVKKETKK